MILEKFGDLGVEVTLIEGETLTDIDVKLRDLVSNGIERIVVAGGDGMIHSAIQAVAQSETILGFIPIGTGNDFCRSLGYPMDIAQAIERSLGDDYLTDLLRINGRWAASVVTFGFSGDVNTKAEAMKWPNGPSRYTLATLAVLPSLKSQVVELVIDEIDGILESAVIGIPDQDFGEAVAALIVYEKNECNPAVKEILKLLKEKIEMSMCRATYQDVDKDI